MNGKTFLSAKKGCFPVCIWLDRLKINFSCLGPPINLFVLGSGSGDLLPTVTSVGSVGFWIGSTGWVGWWVWLDTPNDNLNNDSGSDDDDDMYLFLVMAMLIISDFAFEGFCLLYKLFKLFLVC